MKIGIISYKNAYLLENNPYFGGGQSKNQLFITVKDI